MRIFTLFDSVIMDGPTDKPMNELTANYYLDLLYIVAGTLSGY